MREVRPSINSVHNYLEGYDRMLEKQDCGHQLSMFQANVARFSSRGNNQNGNTKLFNSKTS